MGIVWDDSLETGDREIDVHHQAFFVKAQEISDACRGGRGAAVIEEMLDFLTAYANHHFKAEKKRMEAINYEYAGTHQAQHEELIARLGTLRERLKTKGPSDKMAEDVRDMVVSWLYDHIKGSDFPLIRQLKAQNVEVEDSGPPPGTT